MDDANREYLEKLDELANATDYLETYGFEHNCTCSEDWAEGKVGLVSECYAMLTDDALETCRRFKGEKAELERATENLRIQVTELGAEPRA